jgi:hypothetical protein
MSQNSTHTTGVGISSLQLKQTESGQTVQIDNTIVEVPRSKEHLEYSPMSEQYILVGALGLLAAGIQAASHYYRKYRLIK